VNKTMKVNLVVGGIERGEIEVGDNSIVASLLRGEYAVGLRKVSALQTEIDRSSTRPLRYCYHNRAYIKAGAAHGVLCDPVRRDGKCVVGGGKQAVVFEDGVEVIVIRRCLRLREKCSAHKRD